MFYLFPRIVKPEVCDKIVKDCLSWDLKPAEVHDADISSSRDNPSIRKTLIYIIPTDKNNTANEIAWYFLKEANKLMFKYDLTYFEPMQFAKYKDGGFFDWHVDTLHHGVPNKLRKLSLSLMLTDPDTFEGGEFQFFNGSKPIIEKGDKTGEHLKNDLKAKGSIVIFDSRDFHRVTPVTKGTRHAAICWATGANFK